MDLSGLNARNGEVRLFVLLKSRLVSERPVIVQV